jgi:hypothetical protein
MSSGTELSALVFGQHVHLILILVIFSFGVVPRTKLTAATLERKNRKKTSIGKFQVFPHSVFRR